MPFFLHFEICFSLILIFLYWSFVLSSRTFFRRFSSVFFFFFVDFSCWTPVIKLLSHLGFKRRNSRGVSAVWQEEGRGNNTTGDVSTITRNSDGPGGGGGAKRRAFFFNVTRKHKGRQKSMWRKRNKKNICNNKKVKYVAGAAAAETNIRLRYAWQPHAQADLWVYLRAQRLGFRVRRLCGTSTGGGGGGGAKGIAQWSSLFTLRRRRIWRAACDTCVRNRVGNLGKLVLLLLLLLLSVRAFRAGPAAKPGWAFCISLYRAPGGSGLSAIPARLNFFMYSINTRRVWKKFENFAGLESPVSELFFSYFGIRAPEVWSDF